MAGCSAAQTAQLMASQLDMMMVQRLVEQKAHPKVAQTDILTVRHWADQMAQQMVESMEHKTAGLKGIQRAVLTVGMWVDLMVDQWVGQTAVLKADWTVDKTVPQKVTHSACMKVAKLAFLSADQ